MERLTNRNKETGEAYLFNGIGGVNEAIDKLATYEDAAEHGRLVVLPCNVGDRVYTIEKHFRRPLTIEEHTVEGFDVQQNKAGEVEVSDPGEWGYDGLVEFQGVDWKWYLTREEAEKALEGMNNG